MPAYAHLIGFETGGIQAFIFEGRRLREMRGASALLDQEGGRALRALVEERFGERADVLRSQGGVLLLGVPEGTGDPEALVNEIETAVLGHLRAEVPGASVYAARVACEAGQDVSDQLARFNFAVARRQGQSPAADPGAELLGPLARFCDSCGRRPAAEPVSVGGDADLLCRVCARKSDYGRRVRHGQAPGSAFARFARYADERDGWSEADVREAVPDDFGAIAETAPDGDLALILADGNRLGQTLRHLTSFEQYTAFSRGVAEVVEDAVFEALAEATETHRTPDARDEMPWEIVFLGGDDVLLVTAADLALPVALALMEKVEEKSAALMEELGLAEHRERIAMAAGVAIGPPSTPFDALRELASALEGRAKDAAYARLEAGTPECSTIDFHRLTSSGQVSLARIREQEMRPRRRPAGEDVRLTMRPYTTEGLRGVLRVAKRWNAGGLPGHKLQYLRERLFESPAEAALGWTHVIGRASEKRRSTWRALSDHTRAAQSDGTARPATRPNGSSGGDETLRMPWLVEDGDADSPARRYTYLFDVLDLMRGLPSG